jgi:hypothetical protein
MNRRSALRYLHLLWLIPLWCCQYLVVVPSVYTWRLLVLFAGFFVGVFALGALAVVLVCIPVIGWLALLVLVLSRPRNTYHRPRPHHSNAWMFKPWLASALTVRNRVVLP